MHISDFQPNKESQEEAIAAGLFRFGEYILDSRIANKGLIVIVNMKEPSYRKRLYVYDLTTSTVIREHHCAHGINSSDPHNRAMAISFSNQPNSRKSSLGAMYTGSIYTGKHGKSLKLHGLEKGINDNVEKRYIVVHGAKYVTDRYIKEQGRVGQSHGCPAVDPYICSSLIELIKEGVFFYIHGGSK